MKTIHGIAFFMSLVVVLSLSSCNTETPVATAEASFVNNSSFPITALYLELYSTTLDTDAVVPPTGAFDQLKTVPDTLITGQKYTINYIPVGDYYVCFAFAPDSTDLETVTYEYVVDAASTATPKSLYKYVFEANSSYTITFTDDSATLPTTPVLSALVKN